MGGLVSVILPTYDRLHFVEDAVESTLQQSYADLELIVIDSGSNDGTREYLNSIDDNRLELVFQDRPYGLSNARNAGLDVASGEYIVFLDDDDVLFQNAIEILVETIREQPRDCGGVYTAQRRYHQSGLVKEWRVTPGTVEEWEETSINGPSCTLVRSDVVDEIGQYDESFPASEDADFWIRLLSSFTLFALDKVLYERRCHDEQMVNDPHLMLRGSQRIVEKHGDSLSKNSLAKRYYKIGRHHAELNQPKRARINFRRSLKLDPFRKAALYYYVCLHLGSIGYRVGRSGHRHLYRSLVNAVTAR